MSLGFATNFRFWIYDLRARLKFSPRIHRKSEIVNHKLLNAAFFRWPDDLVQLGLKPDRQRISNDFFRQLAP